MIHDATSSMYSAVQTRRVCFQMKAVEKLRPEKVWGDLAEQHVKVSAPAHTDRKTAAERNQHLGLRVGEVP